MRSLVFADDLFEELVPYAQAAEGAAFDRVWTTEWATRDATVRAQLIAGGTSKIGVGTGIAYAFTRPPVAAATQAADIYAVSGGRFTLGLGVGTRGVRERYYGQTFDHPATRFEEYVKVMRAALAARAGLTYSGRFYEISAPVYSLAHDPALLGGLEICGAGVNGIMLRAVARVCDGVLLHPITRAEPFFTETVLPAIASGAATNDREPWIAMWCLTSIDADEERARSRGRRSLAFYFSTPTYGSVVEGTPWAAPVEAIRDGFRAASTPDLDALGTLIPDDMLDALVLAGTPADVAVRLREVEASLAARGVREVVLQPAALGYDREDAARAYAGVIEACSNGLSAGTSSP